MSGSENMAAPLPAFEEPEMRGDVSWNCKGQEWPAIFLAEACPDVEVTLQVIRGEEVQEVEASINISRTVIEVKRTLSNPLQLQVGFMEIYKGSTHFSDNDKTLMDYEVTTDDVLVIIDNAPP